MEAVVTDGTDGYEGEVKEDYEKERGGLTGGRSSGICDHAVSCWVNVNGI